LRCATLQRRCCSACGEAAAMLGIPTALLQLRLRVRLQRSMMRHDAGW
jgi:hypothetical protein